ncbi:hypothetical protein [Nonomuraea rubra]|uniref:MFS transporter n=1 Tax=Nonomuraea rubra TaxID=46180 RepID=A0A7X0TZX9_9ACTN|nr:hypothetical protein [Nonomuraea rubra]MBB6549973.1 hypothetical protein [Nonomuraea rubra]
MLALAFVPPLRSGLAQRLDLAGVALATAGLGGVVFGLIEGERYGWATVAGPIVAGVALLVAFVLLQRRREAPLMPLALFRVRNFAVGNAAGFVFQLGMIGVMFALVLYLQLARGYSALETGLVLLPGAVLTAAGSAYAGRLSDRFGGRYVAASGVSSTIRQAGGVVGTAVLGVLLSARLSSALRAEAGERAGLLPEPLRARFVEDSAAAARHYSPPAPPGGLDPATAALYERVTAETFAAGFVTALHTALVACAVVLVAAAVLCLLFSPPGSRR